MFRALFRRPRPVRVPIEESGRQLRPVRLGKRSDEPSPANFLVKVFVAYCVFRFIETTGLLGFNKESKEAQENIRRHKNVEESDQAAEDGSRSKLQKLIDQSKKQIEQAKRGQKDGEKDKSLVQEQPKSHSDAEMKRLRTILERQQAAAAKEEAMTEIYTVPVWFHAKPRMMYTRDDQEYKDFARLQSDEKKVQQLKEGVSQYVMQRLQHPWHQRQLQHIKFNGTAAAVFELVPQIYAPTTYQVPCVVIKPSSMPHLGWRDLPPELSSRFQNIFRPTLVYKASKASTFAFFQWTYHIMGAKAEKTLGISLPGYSPNFRLGVAAPVSDKAVGQGNGVPSNEPNKTSAPGFQQLTEAMHNKSCKHHHHHHHHHHDALSNTPFSSAVSYAKHVFGRVRQREQAAQAQHQARGIVQIRGTVVCLGETGKYKLDVIAHYLPSEDAFISWPTIRNWYIVQDYAAVERAVEEKERGGRKPAAPKPLADGETNGKNDERKNKPTEE